MIGQTTDAAGSATVPETPEAPASTPFVENAPEGAPAPEYGGRKGLDPTRYGDWEKNGRCIDF